MNREEIIEKLTPIVRANLQNESLELRDDMSAENVSTWTSLAFMQMLTDIENEFGIKFKMMELIRLRTMGDIIQSLEAHLANA
ncbi:MAG: acyl carrier protein [Paludibacteraceae bacterium]|nr:acyl carrier protein [Paludibacteraceae bacterium]